VKQVIDCPEGTTVGSAMERLFVVLQVQDPDPCRKDLAPYWDLQIAKVIYVPNRLINLVPR